MLLGLRLVLLWQPLLLPSNQSLHLQLLESEAQKEGHPGTLQQVMAKAGLDRMHFHPPYNQQVCVGQMDLSAAKVLSSKKVSGLG